MVSEIEILAPNDCRSAQGMDRRSGVIATGGTGVTGRDVTPEAFEAVYDKAIPGFGELFR